MGTGYLKIGMLLCMLLTMAQASAWVLNNPYPQKQGLQKIYYSSFGEQPKTLDPARSYSSNEYQFIAQIYEPLLQYNYLKRPYTLIPLSSLEMPTVTCYDKAFAALKTDQCGNAAYSVYRIKIKPGIYYQPHPAFAKNSRGEYRYFNLSADYLDDNDISELADFTYTGTRELIADDYLYQIKRLASPKVSSPIYGLMSEHILGFAQFSEALPSTDGYVNLNQYPMAGLNKIDNYTFEITIKNQYPQFLYWLAMPFFAPIPWEADRFYSQPGMDDKNLSFDWYPVGTGAFMLVENNPNRQMVLHKNPNYRQEFFPQQGSANDIKAGYLRNAGKQIPLIDEAVYTLEKETIPRWNKFLQGYYDLSGVTTDSFDQAIQIDRYGEPTLTPSMLDKKIRLTQTVDPTIYYLGFNMLDPIVGGTSERARKLRLAISIAVNFDENIAIFFNGRGRAAQGPIPPGIFGFLAGEKGINPYIYRWNGRHAQRRSIKEAQKLMAEAGYPQGRDPATAQPLILNYDVPVAGGPDDKAQLDWMRKQFAKIGIDLNVRGTQYNRFQEKMRSGNAQIFSWGWNADYPDPENFLFMLYSPNGKVKFGGENASNYTNTTYDRLFELMKNKSNDASRQQLIDQMVEIVRHDSPWAFGINSESLVLSQQWVSAVKPSTFTYNSLKYLAVDVPLRNQLRQQWNQALFWPLLILFVVALMLALPLWFAYRNNEQRPAKRTPS